ncbi:hypothetical protein Hanom_Chr06g00569741 [Helianthus anomalus]
MQPNDDTVHTNGFKPNDGVGNGFEGYAASSPMGTQQARKRRSAIHDGGNLMSLCLDHDSVHSVGKQEVDSFINFNDVGGYHVATDNL